MGVLRLSLFIFFHLIGFFFRPLYLIQRGIDLELAPAKDFINRFAYRIYSEIIGILFIIQIAVAI